jgi:hypothetical protein
MYANLHSRYISYESVDILFLLALGMQTMQKR